MVRELDDFWRQLNAFSKRQLVVIRVVFPRFIRGDISRDDDLVFMGDPNAEDVRGVISDQVANFSPWLKLLLLRDLVDKGIGSTAVDLEVCNARFGVSEAQMSLKGFNR